MRTSMTWALGLATLALICGCSGDGDGDNPSSAAGSGGGGGSGVVAGSAGSSGTGAPDASDDVTTDAEPDAGGECPVDATPGPGVVITDRGAVQGAQDGTTWTYLGIPYVAPPVDDLRWKPPVRHACWSDVLDTTTMGPKCPQRDEKTGGRGG